MLPPFSIIVFNILIIVVLNFLCDSSNFWVISESATVYFFVSSQCVGFFLLLCMLHKYMLKADRIWENILSKYYITYTPGNAFPSARTLMWYLNQLSWKLNKFWNLLLLWLISVFYSLQNSPMLLFVQSGGWYAREGFLTYALLTTLGLPFALNFREDFLPCCCPSPRISHCYLTFISLMRWVKNRGQHFQYS